MRPEFRSWRSAFRRWDRPNGATSAASSTVCAIRLPSAGAGCGDRTSIGRWPCGLGAVHLAVPVSRQQMAFKLGWEPARVLAEIADVVGYARQQGLLCSLGGEDASRAEPAFLASVISVAAAAGTPVSFCRYPRHHGAVCHLRHIQGLARRERA